MRLSSLPLITLLLLGAACAEPPAPTLSVGTGQASSGLTSAPQLNRRQYGEVFAEDFGAVGFDPPAGKYSYWANPKPMVDNAVALQAALDGVPLGGILRFQSCRYYSSKTLYVRHDMRIEVLGGTRLSVAYCGFYFAAGISGLVLEAPTTLTGVSITSVGRVIPSTGRITDAHGIVMHASSWLDGVGVQYFEGDGIHIECSVPATNCNLFRITGGLTANNAGHGLFVRGSDTNDGYIENLSSVANGLVNGKHNESFNYYDNSFLGNTYIACHSDANPNAYSAGFERINGSRVENRNNKTVFVNCYEEDGTVADLASNATWLFGYGTAGLTGPGPWLKTDGGGLQSRHFTAAPTLNIPAARLGSLAGGAYIGEMTVVRGKPPLYVYPSATRPGKIDFTSVPGSPNGVAMSVSTGASPDGAAFIEFPGGARISGTKVISAPTPPTVGTFKVGDLVLNALPKAGAPWAWQCIKVAPLTFRALPAP